MQVTKGTWRMREQCVPGSLSSSPAQETGNESRSNAEISLRNFFNKIYIISLFWYDVLDSKDKLRLRDTVRSYRSTAHAHGRLSMDFELTRLVQSSVFFLNQK